MKFQNRGNCVSSFPWTSQNKFGNLHIYIVICVFYVISYLKYYIDFDQFVYTQTCQNYVKTIFSFISNREWGLLYVRAIFFIKRFWSILFLIKKLKLFFLMIWSLLYFLSDRRWYRERWVTEGDIVRERKKLEDKRKEITPFVPIW